METQLIILTIQIMGLIKLQHSGNFQWHIQRNLSSVQKLMRPIQTDIHAECELRKLKTHIFGFQKSQVLMSASHFENTHLK